METIDTTDHKTPAHFLRPNATQAAALAQRRARREASEAAHQQERSRAMRAYLYATPELGQSCMRAGAYDAFNLPSRTFDRLVWPATATAPIIYPGIPASADRADGGAQIT